MLHREDTTWVIRIEAGAEFDEAYDGDLDGFAWRELFQRQIQARVVAAVLREISAVPGWRVRTGNRGLPPTDEVLVHVELDVDSEAHLGRR